MALKHSHMLFVAISGLFFLVRGVWMLMESDMLQKKWVKIVPHVVDTLLLACGIGLTVILSQYPFVHHWLTVKVVLLVAYILLGTVALKRGKTKAIRTTAFFVAIACFLFMLSVAFSHHPLGFLRNLI